MIDCSIVLVYAFFFLLSVSITRFFYSLFDASKNGQVVGTVYKDMKGPLFPTIAVHSQNEEYVLLMSFNIIYLIFHLLEWLHCMLLYLVSSFFFLQDIKVDFCVQCIFVK